MAYSAYARMAYGAWGAWGACGPMVWDDAADSSVHSLAPMQEAEARRVRGGGHPNHPSRTILARWRKVIRLILL